MPSRWYLTAYVLCCAALVLAQQPKKDNIAYHATGPFEVKLTPQPPEGEPTTLRRMTVDKQFHGELEAVSQGQMLSVTASTKGSEIGRASCRERVWIWEGAGALKSKT